MEDKFLFVGIDVGKLGAIVIINNESSEIVTIPMPMIGKEYNIQKIAFELEYYSKYIKHLCIENVHAVQTSGRTGSFEFGFGKGILEGIIVTLKIPYARVSAATWQKEMWTGITKQYVAGTDKKKIDTKATSLIAAQRLFPRESFLATEKSKVPHNGIVDALLIADYTRRKFNR